MDVNKAFPSKYLKASDLDGEPRLVVIAKVTIEEVGQNKERKPVVYFQGKKKGMVLNKTNCTKIVALTGEGDTDDWRGQQIMIYPTETEYGGETVDCIRIKAAGNAKDKIRGMEKPKKTKPQPEPDSDPDQEPDREPGEDDREFTDDDIPF